MSPEDSIRDKLFARSVDVLQSPESSGLMKEDAFSQIVTGMTGLLRRHSESVVGDYGSTEDIVQESFLSFWRNIDKFDADKSLYAFLRTIVRNSSIDELRKKANRPDPIGGSEQDLEGGGRLLLMPSAQSQASPDTQVEIRDELGVLDEISADQRRFILLSDLMGLSNTEIASLLGMPLGTVKSRIRFARQAIRRLSEVQVDAEVA